MANLLTDLQESVAERLRSDSDFSTPPVIAVVTQSAGDVATEIAQRIGESGIVVSVLTPSWKPSEVAQDYIDVTLEVGVAEHVLNNRGPTGTGRWGFDLAISITALLMNFRLSGGWSALEFKGGTMKGFTESVVTHAVTFETSLRVGVVAKS